MVPLHKHAAVERNRLKRRIRELVRLELLPRLEEREVTRDVLLRARREAYDAGYAELRNELVTWVERRWPLEPRSA